MSSTGPLSELESLRLQVAELTRTLAERDQALQDRPEQSNLLRAIVEGTSDDIGVEFLRSFVKHLAQSLHVRFAFVGEWREQTPGKVNTLAVWSGTDFAEPFEYDLKGSPCEHVIGKALCLHESDVQEHFPDDQLLVQLEVQSYCGMPLFDQSGTALGLLVVMDDRPFTRAPLIKDLLQVFATKAAAELQRQQAEITLREQARRLCFTQFSLDHAADAVLWADDATRFIYANEAACRSLGYSNEELLTLSIPDISPDYDPARFRQRLDQLKQGLVAIYESVHRRKDGIEFPIEVSVTYLEQDGRGYTCDIVRDITERKHIEQERLQVLHDLQNIMETVPDFMFTLDRQGNMMKWNRRVEEVTGYSPEELLDMPALAFVPPEEQTRTAAAIQRAFAEGYAELDGRLLTKEQRLIPYHWTGALLKSPDGEPIGITGIGRDVTEKKRAEAALKQERQHLVEAQALAHLGSWSWNIESGEEVWSDEQFRIFGYEPGSISVVYETFMAALLPDDHDRVLGAINDALIGTFPYEVECRIVRPNGDVREIQCRGDVHRDESGHPNSMAGTVLDITERKQAESKLRLTQFTIDHAVDAVYWVDREAQIVGVNEAASLMLGYSKGELCAMTVHDLNPDFQADMWPGFWAETRQRKTLAFETFHRSKTGELIPIEVSVNYLSYEGQELHCASVRNITDRKKAQEELRRSKSQLTHILENSPVVVYARQVGEGWPITFITPNVYGLLGYTSVDLLSDPNRLDNLMHPDDERDLMTKGMPQLLRGGALTTVYRLRHRDGIHRWIENRARLNDNGKGALQIAGTMIDVTERKKAEEVLEEERHRLVIAQWLAHLGSWEWNILTGTKTWSDENYKIFGYEPGSIQPTYEIFAQAIHHQDRERVIQAARAMLEDDITSCDLECRIVRPSGEIRHVHCRGEVTRDDAGRPLKMAGTVLDITEQKQTQEALARSERQLRTVLDALPVGVWFTDPSGKPLLANPAAKQIWSGIKQVGIETAANAVGWWEAIGPSSEPHRWALSHVLTKGIPSLYETLDFECLDGTKKTIRNTAVPVQDEAGIVLGAIVLNEDITALREAQEALQLTQFSVDHAVEGFFWIDLDGKILNVNEAVCRMLGYTRDELRAMTLHDIDPNFPPELWSAHWKELKQKGSMTFESKHWSRTGRVLDTEVTANYLQYEGREYNCAIVRDIGERKRIHASLRQSEERYRSLVDNAPIGIFVNEAGRFVYANQEMQRILKAPSAERLIGTSVLDRIAPEFHPQVKDWMRQLMDGRQSAPLLDEQFVRLDGSRIDVAVTAIPTSFDGTPVMQVLVLDITKRKQAEGALREKHALLSAIMDATTDVIFVKDLQGRYLHMNPAGARVVGMSVEEIVGKDDDAIWPADVAACCKAADRKVLTSGTAQTMEESTTVKGTRITYLTTKAPYRDAMGCLIGIIGVAHDITRIKRSQEELRRSHVFLRQVIDSDPNFVFAKDRAGRFTLVNKAVADAYGTTVENLIGKTDADFNADVKEVAFFREKDAEVMDSLQDLFLPEEAITDSTGKMRWLQTVKRPIFDEQGRAIMVLGAATDITDRKRMEEALRQRERALRSAIEERERISQDLHDGILQSLFAVGLSLETTKSMMSPKERKMSGPALQQAIDQLNRLMHEVRNFIAGLGSDLLQGTDLPTALHHMLETLTKNHPTHVRLKIEDRAAQALTAEQALHLLLVIQEAVSNCIRHGHAQEATVSLKLLKQGVRLSVRDNGCGFDSATSKGTGHGLSNMGARAQKIGGRFTVLSKVNEGTRIVLDLPKEVALGQS